MSALKDLDPHSLTWRALKAWAERELDAARSRLEQAGISATDSDIERGDIRRLKALLALADDKPVIPSGSTPY